MNEEMTQQQMMATAERFAHAAEALDRVLDRLDAQQEALNAKVDRIVAAVQGHLDEAEGTAVLDKQDTVRLLQERLAELEKANAELKVHTARMARKTLPTLVSALLGKDDTEAGEKFDPATIDKTLQSLSVEQRIAVKAEMARAGIIE